MFTLLIVEDEPKTRAMNRRSLEWERYGITEVYEAATGKQAIEVGASKKLDLVLMDIRLPDMDGIEVARRISDQHPHAKTIFITAYDDAALLRQALQLHAVDYVLKPVNRLQLVQAVRDALELLRNETRAQALEELVRREAHVLRSRALRRFLTGGAVREDADGLLGLLEIEDTSSLSYALCLMKADEEALGEYESTALSRFIDVKLAETVNRAWLVRVAPGETGLVVAACAPSQDVLDRLVGELRALIGDDEGGGVRVEAGGWVERLEDLASVYDGLKLQLEFSSKRGERPELGFSSRDETVTHRIKTIVRDRFTSENLTIRAMAAELGYSSSYLCMVFKRTTGVTINDYLHLCRIAEAKDMMRETSLELQDIAYEVGYSSENYFAKVFRKHEGMTPSGYRDTLT